MPGLRQEFQIPEDISVVGFDNIEMSKYMYPGLTTINVDQFEIGEQAANLIIGMIEKKKVKVKK